MHSIYIYACISINTYMDAHIHIICAIHSQKTMLKDLK